MFKKRNLNNQSKDLNKPNAVISSVQQKTFFNSTRVSKFDEKLPKIENVPKQNIFSENNYQYADETFNLEKLSISTENDQLQPTIQGNSYIHLFIFIYSYLFNV